MTLPLPNNDVISDVKRLVHKRPALASFAIAGVVVGAIALVAIPFSQQANLTSESRSPDENTSTNRPDSELREEGISISDDDIRIGADIDNLDVLLNEIELSDEATEEENQRTQDLQLDQSNRTTERLEASDMANPEPIDASSNLNSSEQSTSIYDDLFSPITVSNNADLTVPIQSFLSGGLQSSTNTTSSENREANENTAGSLSFGTSQTPNVGSNDLLQYPLIESVNQLSSESSAQNPSSPSVPSRLNQVVNPNSPNSLPLSTDAIQLQTSPLPGTTGYTIPQALQSPINPYTQQVNPQFAPSSVGQFANPTLPNALTVPQQLSSPGFSSPNFGTSSGFNNSTVVTPNIRTTQPFSPGSQPSFAIPTTQTPQSTRYNGGGRGGEINTFSNP